MLGAGQRGEARAEAHAEACATLKYLIIGSNGPEGLNVTLTARSARLGVASPYILMLEEILLL